MPHKSIGSDFLRKNQVSNFGRTERITGAEWTTMIDVDLDEQMDWTVNFDTKQITLTSAANGITSKVMAKVEVGSGNGTSEHILEVTDLAQLPVSGDHLKVALTLVSAVAVTLPTGDSIFLGYGIPSPAPTTDAALVSCFLSSGMILVSPPGIDYPVQPIFGGPAPGALAPLSNAAVIATVPCRLRSFSAFNPASSGALFLNFRSAARVIGVFEPNTPVTLLYTTVLPAQTLVQRQFLSGLPFARGLEWDVTTAADGSSPSASTVRVDLELVRQPSVVVASSVTPTS